MDVPDPRSLELLRAAAAEDLTWRRSGRGISYRLWSSGTDYRTLTPAERRRLWRLLGDGLLRRSYPAGARGVTRGPVDLTPRGLEVLTGWDRP